MGRHHFLKSGRLRGGALVCRGLVCGLWIDLALSRIDALISASLLLAVHLLMSGRRDAILSVAIQVAAKALLVGAALRIHAVRADVAIVRDNLLVVLGITSLRCTIRFGDLIKLKAVD